MPKTMTDANYFHKVVDCQWACPAHTPVPEYIRLIAQGKFTEAYLVNRQSNVFPGILGRVCDRPCEPACRRGRVEEEPVAICRLKRVAADFKDDISPYLPKIPSKKNGKKIAIIGSGPASLTVANDLLPKGYQVSIFEKESMAGGAMRLSVPQFRLPIDVLNEEINTILNMGADIHYSSPVESLKALLAEKFDAIFIGTGAPIGKDLPLPGRDQAGDSVKIGLKWLADVAFEHVNRVEKKILVIGGGNTAMDCCRTAKRIGGDAVRVIVPEGRDQMLASPWEIEETLEEGIEIVNHLLPQEYIHKNGQLSGVRFQQVSRVFDEQGRWSPLPSGKEDITIPCDTVILAIGQATSYPFIEKDIGLDFDESGQVVVDEKTFQSSLPGVFFGGDAAFGPKNIITAVAHGHEASWSVDAYLRKKDIADRPPLHMQLESQKMGIHEWSYTNDYDGENRLVVPHVAVPERIKELKKEVEFGYDVDLALKESARCLNCDVQTVFKEDKCIECDSCIDICPMSCINYSKSDEAEQVTVALKVPKVNPAQDTFVSGTLKETNRFMIKDEDMCLHCGLCVERCPTSAWDMAKSEFSFPWSEK